MPWDRLWVKSLLIHPILKPKHDIDRLVSNIFNNLRQI